MRGSTRGIIRDLAVGGGPPKASDHWAARRLSQSNVGRASAAQRVCRGGRGKPKKPGWSDALDDEGEASLPRTLDGENDSLAYGGNRWGGSPTRE